MAHARARKADRVQRPGSSLTPIAVVVGLGIVTSVFVNNSDRLPIAQLAALRPAVVSMLPNLQAVWLMHKTYTVNGRAWKLATMTPVTDFNEAEMVPIQLTGHHRIWANRTRGVSGLGSPPHAYDRLYLELKPHVYAPLRWRDVP